MRRLTKILVSFLFTLIVVPLLLTSVYAQPEPDKVIEIKGTDNLKFTKTELTARPGEVVKVKLTTVSDYSKQAMAHNFVLLNEEADPAKVASASAKHNKNEYIAPEMEKDMIAYTGMAGDGETVSVTFTVPEKQGEYPYICSFPGHYAAGMKGTLKVISGKVSR